MRISIPVCFYRLGPIRDFLHFVKNEKRTILVCLISKQAGGLPLLPNP